MSTTTSIEWATKTWGPVLGCKKVSAGCDNCYAIGFAHRHASNPGGNLMALYGGLTVHEPGRGVDWTGVVRTVPERLGDPLRWPRPERVFVNSQSDLFHPAVGVEFTGRVLATIAATPRHTYQVLTKRPDVALKVMTDPALQDAMAKAYLTEIPKDRRPGPMIEWPLPNLWLGVSVEDQATADDRIPKLLRTPAAVRWISAEPLLGPIDLTDCDGVDAVERDWVGSAGGGTGCPHPLLDWVVTGGESGPGARPAHPDWFRAIRDHCAAAGVPHLHKQNGAWAPTRPGDGVRQGDVCMTPDGGTDTAGPGWVCFANESEGTQLRRVGKKAAGRELDGVLHDAYPEPVR